MARTVFILGAGASKHAGAPLMNEFLEAARDLLASGNLGAAEEQNFGLVRKGVNELQLAHSKGDLDIWNLETVFDAFEMAALVGCLGDLKGEEVNGLPEAMREVILTTLQEKIVLPLENRSGSFLAVPTQPYARFVEALVSARQNAGAYPAVITFNYDNCLELALYRGGRTWSYCLDSVTHGDCVKLLKLHGSLNWGFCESCGTVGESRDWPKIVEDTSIVAARLWQSGERRMHLKVVTGPLGAPQCRCESSKRSPMLVPPTISKGHYHNILSKVWAVAAAELRTAEEIFVCGYSLAETDLFFRYLYSVGTIGEASLRRFWVFNPDPGVKPRFEALLGKQVLSQPGRFLLFPSTFDNMNWGTVLRHDLRTLPPPV